MAEIGTRGGQTSGERRSSGHSPPAIVPTPGTSPATDER
jgi:hypothetical protein